MFEIGVKIMFALGFIALVGGAFFLLCVIAYRNRPS